MADGNYSTYKDLHINTEGYGHVIINANFSENVRSTSLILFLNQFVSLPNSVTVKAEVDGVQRVVLSKFKPRGNALTFPETTSKKWVIELSYSQPLKINELRINNLDFKGSPSVIRFLAQPDKEYRLYTDPETIISQSTSERPNLNRDGDVKKINLLSKVANHGFRLADTDEDGISDIHDNCVHVANSDQVDVNENGRGDVCDDFDKDGVTNASDNCINEPNRNQRDTDNDGIGDICDGEESRVTEKYPWIVWGGIILAALIFLSLFAIAVKKIRFNKENQDDTSQGPDTSSTNPPADTPSI